MYYGNMNTVNPTNMLLTLEQIKATREMSNAQRKVFEVYELEEKINTLQKLYNGEIPEETKKVIAEKILNSI